jgi:hypothetical protein
MPRISQKRTIDIPPVKIDGDLLFRVGKILKEVCPEQGYVKVSLNSDSMDIGIDDIEELKSQTIPVDTDTIEMRFSDEVRFDENTPDISITINTKFPKKESKIRVYGKDATWVQGVSERLCKEFNENKLSYGYLSQYSNLRFLLAMVTSALLSYVTGIGIWYFTANSGYSVIFVAVFFYAFSVLLNRFYDWLFPYFELDNKNFKPKKYRKLALTFLWGSGILPTIIIRLLGL